MPDPMNPFSYVAGLFGGGGGEPGTDQGILGNLAANTVFGPPQKLVQQRMLIDEKQRAEGVTRSDEEAHRDAQGQLMEIAAGLRHQQPDASPDVLFKMMIQDKNARGLLMDIPAGQHAPVLKDILSALQPPAANISTLAEGAASIARNPRTGEMIGQPFVNPGRPQVVGPDAALVGRRGDELYRNPGRPMEDKVSIERQKAEAKERAEQGGKLIAKVYDDGNAAQNDLPRFEELRRIVEANPGGAGTALRGKMAEWGINVAGKTDLQLWTALLNQAAPKTREAGSGVFTDKDFDAALKGLPGMLKGKDANVKLADMMLDWLEYRVARGQAASRYFEDDNATRGEVFKALKAVKPGKRSAPKKKTLRYNPETGELEAAE